MSLAAVILIVAVTGNGTVVAQQSGSGAETQSPESSTVNLRSLGFPKAEDAGGHQADSAAYVTSSWTIMLLGIYCTLIVTGSLLGGWLPSMIDLTHNRMQTVISLVGGLMLGIGIFHLLPHAIMELESVDTAVVWMMAGIICMFLLIRTFHFHNHGVAESGDGEPCPIDHDHSHEHHHSHPQSQAHRFSWLGILVGLSLHTLIDGVALGASVAAESSHRVIYSLYGIGTFLAIMLHKPLDAVSITSLMVAGGWKTRTQNWVNAGFAMMCPLGAALFLMSATRFSDSQHLIVGCGMAFSAGVFVCIALSDLLPEMEFHSHHRMRLSVALAVGISLAWAIRLLEAGHVH
jgi:zinc and cadmium transporter